MLVSDNYTIKSCILEEDLLFSELINFSIRSKDLLSVKWEI